MPSGNPAAPNFWRKYFKNQSIGPRYATIEPLAQNCTQVLVWQTMASGLSTAKRLRLETPGVANVNVNKLWATMEAQESILRISISAGEFCGQF
jgi:hypothetical protein